MKVLIILGFFCIYLSSAYAYRPNPMVPSDIQSKVANDPQVQKFLNDLAAEIQKNPEKWIKKILTLAQTNGDNPNFASCIRDNSQRYCALAGAKVSKSQISSNNNPLLKHPLLLQIAKNPNSSLNRFNAQTDIKIASNTPIKQATNNTNDVGVFTWGNVCFLIQNGFIDLTAGAIFTMKLGVIVGTTTTAFAAHAMDIGNKTGRPGLGHLAGAFILKTGIEVNDFLENDLFKKFIVYGTIRAGTALGCMTLADKQTKMINEQKRTELLEEVDQKIQEAVVPLREENEQLQQENNQLQQQNEQLQQQLNNSGSDNNSYFRQYEQ